MNAPETPTALPADTWVRSRPAGVPPTAPATVWIPVLLTWIWAVGAVVSSVFVAVIAWEFLADEEYIDVSEGHLSTHALILRSVIVAVAISAVASTVAWFATRRHRWAHTGLVAIGALMILSVLFVPFGFPGGVMGAAVVALLLTPSARAWPRTAR